MLGMDLATLSIPDLRRVLDIARARGQADLADSVVAELRARAEASVAGVAEGPRAMGFGGQAPSDPVAAGMRDATWWDDEDPDLAPRRRAPIVILGIAAAVMVAGGVGWGLTRGGGAEVAAAAPPAPAVAPAPEPRAPVVTAVTAVTAEVPAPLPADDAPPNPAAAAVAVATVEGHARPVAPTTGPRRASCLARPTPADRLVCGYPTLGRQHERMVAAYGRALMVSGDDPLVLDAGQAKWRAVRDRVSDRRKLADLYQRRIDELDAIAARPKPKLDPARKPEPEQPIF